MLPDDFVFVVDITGEFFHCKRREDRKIELRPLSDLSVRPAIVKDSDITCYIGNGWTIVSTAEDEQEIDIQNLL